MKKFKKLLTILTAVALVFSLSAIMASAAAVTVAVDGKPVSISASYGAPYVDSANRTQIPIRAISETLGATVSWDQSAQTAVIDGNIKIKLGASTISTPSGSVTMDTTAVASNGRIYVPFRFLCQALGYDVDYTTSGGNTTVNIVTKVELTINAAASLTDAMNEVAKLYNAEKPNTKLTFNYDASGTLRKQIEQGAPVDLFFSADTKNMDTLKNEGLAVNTTIKNLLGNDLVLVVPKNSTLKISTFADVATSAVKMIALGDTTSVPAGTYAKETFTYYNVWDEVQKKATFDNNVRTVLTHVASGNVDCGVVYRTDALTEPDVKIVCTAIDASHTPIVYPGAVVKASAHQVAAADFMNFMSTSAAKAVFEKYGFKTF
ncbi:molybdenum ABC transporter, molybdate-binding protein [Sporobacter termitidis DSM 10068]|uniref:Molybdenum ABC transporter, molybdate-binding protein n=1 Tax=Sporobacter termitidis DSM 10068 TaxID=1123282 RepID=A0A1M5UUA0_9FIRM|nr:molybdate ABC transporter substrate-binding protein [Sporobacter termitidis]SHH66627.1 molybdenum ABC transporter, molybdate-binding protein [Sporobacter termitidis DSM 10068]